MPQPPARAQRLVDIGFIIAFAFQGAIWARELILGADRAAASATETTRIDARQRDGDHPRAGQRRSVRAGDHRHPRQSRGQRHRAGRRPRHRRHRHRPRRAGHLLRPVRGACHPVRQAVPARRHDPLRQRPPARSSGSASRPRACARSAASRSSWPTPSCSSARSTTSPTAAAAAHRRCRSACVYQTPPEKLERLDDIATRGRRSASRAASSSAACSPAFGARADRLSSWSMTTAARRSRQAGARTASAIMHRADRAVLRARRDRVRLSDADRLHRRARRRRWSCPTPSPDRSADAASPPSTKSAHASARRSACPAG